MRDKTPYNAGELRDTGSKKVLIAGHVYWPVEKQNAYHCILVDEYGNPKSDKPEYIWDHGENWTVFEPKVA